MINYKVTKKNNKHEIVFMDLSLNGLGFSPKNKRDSKSINVNELIIIKPSFIEKILRKKIDKKIKNFMIKIIEDFDENDDDSTSDDSINEILNQTKRFRSVLKHEYSKYLEEIEIKSAIKKVSIIEREVMIRMMQKQAAKINSQNTVGKAR